MQTKSSTDDVLGNDEYSHPSFGQISFSRIQGKSRFYGSELEQDHYIEMKVHKSYIRRAMARDWYHTKEIPLIKVRLTSGQFSEMITTMNRGEGVPCTIEMVNQKYVDPLPEIENRKEFVHNRFKDRMKRFADTLKEKQNRVKELTAKKTLSKADQEELNKTVEWLTTEVASNIPFFAECFQETMDEVVSEAKMEVENAIQHKINTLGLNALHEQNKLLGNK